MHLYRKNACWRTETTLRILWLVDPSFTFTEWKCRKWKSRVAFNRRRSLSKGSFAAHKFPFIIARDSKFLYHLREYRLHWLMKKNKKKYTWVTKCKLCLFLFNKKKTTTKKAKESYLVLVRNFEIRDSNGIYIFSLLLFRFKFKFP